MAQAPVARAVSSPLFSSPMDEFSPADREAAVGKIQELVSTNKVGCYAGWMGLDWWGFGGVGPGVDPMRLAPSVQPILFQCAQVMLFMKGTKLFPQCGFSNTAVSILRCVGFVSDRPTLGSIEWT